MLTDQQFKSAAELIGCSVAAIRAVYEVEAAGRGYLPDGRVKILFEGHRFWKGLVGLKIPLAKIQLAAANHPNVLYKDWNKAHYKGGVWEWARVSEAYQVCTTLDIDTAFALNFASYGCFQIMGENHSLCGYASAHEMLAAYNNGGEAEQLNSFVRFVKARSLDDELRALNWAGFAKGYNGTAYRLNRYDDKLAAAYKKYKG